LAGNLWLYFNTKLELIKNMKAELCLFKLITNFPCPSCGTTRSIISIIKGNYIEAFYFNPLGYLTALIMFIVPLWIIIDLLFKTKSFFSFYLIIEDYLRKPKIAIALIALVLINWIWNILKGL